MLSTCSPPFSPPVTDAFHLFLTGELHVLQGAREAAAFPEPFLPTNCCFKVFILSITSVVTQVVHNLAESVCAHVVSLITVLGI